MLFIISVLEQLTTVVGAKINEEFQKVRQNQAIFMKNVKEYVAELGARCDQLLEKNEQKDAMLTSNSSLDDGWNKWPIDTYDELVQLNTELLDIDIAKKMVKKTKIKNGFYLLLYIFFFYYRKRTGLIVCLNCMLVHQLIAFIH